MRQIKTAPEAIDALGGTKEVAQKMGCTYQAVHNWRRRGLPADTRDALERLLTEKGCTAPPELWRQREVKQ